jgi:trigger factor
MQVTETLVDGLKREFKVVVPATELDGRLIERLNSLKDEVRIKGFRPGKVPMSHLKRLFGRSTMAEIVQDVISEVARNTLSGRGEKAAMQPHYELPEDQGEANEVLAGNHDLAYTMSYEVLPKIDLIDFKTISVERPTIEVADAEVEEQLSRLADSTRSYTTKAGAADTGDRITVSYLGKIGGEPFEGGSDDNAVIRIGDKRFIPGFEEQLVGLSTGDKKTITVTFPEDYAAKQLAGKEATFDIEVKAVAAGDEVTIDDKLAERLGLESLVSLRDTCASSFSSNTPRRPASGSSGRYSTGSTRPTGSICPSVWSIRSSRRSGARSSPSWPVPGAASRTRTPPRRRPRPNIARSPNAACGSA